MPKIKLPNQSGIRLAIQYGYVPCKLGLCGPEDKRNKSLIFRYLKGASRLEPINREIQKQFQGAYAYYKLIARANGVKDPLDYRVVQAYWIGNKLLDKITLPDFKKMALEEFVPLGKITAKRVNQIPENAIPHHTFHVLFMGSITGRAKLEGKTLDICRVGWGKIQKIKYKILKIKYYPLKVNKNIVLGKPIIKEIKWNKEILPKVRTGDWISIHWNHAIEKLNADQLKNLKKYTRVCLKSLFRREIVKF